MSDNSTGGLSALLAVALVAIAIFLLAPLGAAIGALTAVIVSWWFPDVMEHMTGYFGFSHAYQLGAALGYVGTFFRTPKFGK